MTRFVNEFDPEREAQQESVNEISDFIKSFQMRMTQRFPYESAENRAINNDEIEAIVMRALYEKAYDLVAETERDSDMAYRMDLFDFIQPEHLELDSDLLSPDSLAKVRVQVAKINSLKAPRDKLVAIVNSCKLVSAIVRGERPEQNGKELGADDFLPVLIYCVLRAKPNSPISDIAYIKWSKKDLRQRQ